MKRLEGRIAVVAGATRGAGRGIAEMLGAEGATVYCTGRSVRGRPATGNRPETIDETAERVTARGGKGIAVRTDHTEQEEVIALSERIRAEAGAVHILVNDVWGGDALTDWGKKFWELDVQKLRTLLDRAVYSHALTSRYLAPLMFGVDRGLIVEITDGDVFGYRGHLGYDLVKMAVIRLAFSMSRELKDRPITALAVTPGFLRSEEMLERFGVTEANWRDGTKVEPHFIESETPYFVGRAVAALAADPNVAAKAGRVFSSWDLAKEYDFDDADGRRPDWKTYFEAHLGKYNRAEPEAYDWWLNGPAELVGIPPADDQS